MSFHKLSCKSCSNMEIWILSRNTDHFFEKNIQMVKLGRRAQIELNFEDMM